MKHLGLLLALFLVALPAFAQDTEFAAPTCLRILKATATEATLQFEPHGVVDGHRSRLSACCSWRLV